MSDKTEIKYIVLSKKLVWPILAWGTVDIKIDFDNADNRGVHLWETVILKKEDQKWKIVHGMASIPGSTKE